MPPGRICIVNFSGFRPNWGCQATSWELLKFVNSVFLPGCVPTVSFVPLPPPCELDTQMDRHFEAVCQAIENICTAKHDAAADRSFLESICLQRYGFWADEVKASDLVLFQAEGTLTGSHQFHTDIGLLLLPFVAGLVW